MATGRERERRRGEVALLGKSLGHFEVLEPLGHGGMGEVYLARDTRLDRKVAIKILASDLSPATPAKLASSRLARLRREATALARLNHPNIVSVHSIEETDDLVFVVMEWVDGVRLRDLIPSNGFEMERFLDLAIPIAQALDAAHASGITHRDLKPENIMVSRSGSEPGASPDGTVKVLDFGLARLHEDEGSPHEETLTGAQQVLGTLPYMSPEQLTGDQVGPASDLFSLGTVFYEMLTGRRPFSGDSNASLSKAILYSAPPRLSTLSGRYPEALAQLIELCHQKDPRNRPGSPSYVVSRLAALRDGRPISQVTQTLEHAPTAPYPPATSASSSSSDRTLSIDDLSRSRARTLQSQRSERFSIGLALLAAVLATVIAVNFLPRAVIDPITESMIVLPFDNLTGDGELSYLSTGLSASLLDRLSGVGDIRLLEQPDSDGAQTRQETPGETAQRFGARYVVDGVLQGSREQLSVGVTIIDSQDGRVMWTEKYRGRLEEILELENTLTADLVRVLSIKLSASERKRLDDGPPDSWQAFDLFLKAQKLIDHHQSVDDLNLAISLLDQAGDLDPAFARAQAASSSAYWYRFARSRDSRDLDAAEAAASRALKTDPALPAGRLAMARVHRSRGQAQSSIDEIDEILAEIPRKDDAYRELGYCYERVGDLDNARLFYRAATLFDSQGWYNWNELGVLLDRMGEYEEATSALEMARDLAPQGVTTPIRNLGSLRIHQGDFEGALELFEQIPGPTRNGRLASNIATAYFFSDRNDRLEKAERYYRLAARLEPSLAEIHGNLADVLLIRSKNEEAKKHYQVALQLVEDSLELENADGEQFHQLRLVRATYAAKAGLCPRALEEAVQLIPLVPQTAGDYHRLAYPLALCGAEEQAIDALERSVELGFSPELIAMESEFSGLATSQRFQALVDVD